MAKKSNRAKPKDLGRRTKKKVSVLTTEKVDYIDYKDVNLLKKFISDRAKVRARRVTGNDTQQQAEVARAIKNAREMALLPYATRVTTQRGGRDRGRKREREAAPLVGRALQRERAAEGFGEPATDREPEPEARLSIGGLGGPLEGLEDLALLGDGDPEPRVVHRDARYFRPRLHDTTTAELKAPHSVPGARLSGSPIRD